MELPDHSTARDIAGEDLLSECVRCLGSQLDPLEERALRRWWKGQHERAGTLVGALLSRSEAQWTNAIVMHPAHRHPFYDELSDAADAEEFAALLLEDRGSPAFLPLLERTLHVLTPVESRATLLGNVEDVQVPARHAALMRRLITVIKARVNEDVRLELSQSLIDRTLIFYYGYYCEPWNLIGSLYATEVMGRNRLMRMEAGLERLGFDPADLEFIRAQMVSDEDHARDWIEGIIAPSVRANPALRTPIAEGIAACLGTSARHLDDLLRRAMRRRWEDRSIFRPWQHLGAATVTAATAPSSSGPPALFVAVTEDKLTSSVSAGENRGVTLSHEHVVREWLGPIALNAGHVDFKQTVTDRSSWNFGQLGIAGFVQDLQTGQVLQAVGASQCLRS